MARFEGKAVPTPVAGISREQEITILRSKGCPEASRHQARSGPTASKGRTPSGASRLLPGDLMSRAIRLFRRRGLGGGRLMPGLVRHRAIRRAPGNGIQERV